VTGADPASAPDGLTVLGGAVRHPVEHLETFPTPPSVRRVRFRTEEVTSMCPVTGQPDFSTVEIDYEPAARCIESKSLKLYLWGFRDQPIFAEGLAAAIAAEVRQTVEPAWVKVTVTQHVRGGIVTEAIAELP
jgi:7-cyano-7-deazaguanine reductase